MTQGARQPETPVADEFVALCGGEFSMGSDRHYPEEAPVHRVSVDGSP